MLLSRLAEAWAALSATRSRNAKRELITAVLADATADDIDIVVSYLGGSLRQRRTGLGWRSLRELPPPAADPALTVIEVDAAFAELADLSGPGSAAARARRASELFARATKEEQGFLRGLVFGELRQGALDAPAGRLAQAYGAPVTIVRRAAMLLSSTTTAARLLVTGGTEALEQVGLQVGTPIQPMLAARPHDATSVSKLDEDVPRSAARPPAPGHGLRCRVAGTHCGHPRAYELITTQCPVRHLVGSIDGSRRRTVRSAAPARTRRARAGIAGKEEQREDCAAPTIMNEATVRKSVAGSRNVMTHLFQTGLPWALPAPQSASRTAAAKPCRQLG